MTTTLFLIVSLLAPTLEGDWPTSDARITLEGKDMPIGEAVKAIADKAGWSLVMPDANEHERMDVSLKEIPVVEALEGVLAAQRLRAVRAGNLVTVIHKSEPDRPAERRGRRQDRMKVGGGVVVEEGETVGDAVAVGGSVEVRGKVHDAVAVGGDVHVSKSGEVRGDAVTVGGRLNVEPGGTVAGDRVEVGPGMIPKRLLGGLLGLGAAGAALGAVWSIMGTIVLFIILFAFGLVLFALSPSRLQAVGNVLAARPIKSGLVGILAAIVATLLTALLAVSLIGIPLALLLVLGVMMASLFGLAALALRLGHAIPLWPAKNTALALAMGALAILIVCQIPWLGGFLLWLATLAAFGAVVMTRVGGTSPTSTPTTPVQT